MNDFILAYFGYFGSFCILLALFLNTGKLLDTENIWYSILNIVGATILAIVAFKDGVWSVLALQIVWAGLALFKISNPLFGWNEQKSFPLQTTILVTGAIILVLSKMEYFFDKTFFYNLFGYVGDILLVWAYYLNINKKTNPAGVRYQLINLFGAIALLVPSLMAHTWEVVITVSIWGLLMIINLVVIACKRN